MGFLLWGVWSLNERAAGREGCDLPCPSGDYLGELVKARELDQEAQRRRDSNE